MLRAGGAPTPLAMNCSGKHAAMLATCVLQGWDTATYRDPDHPLQQAIAATYAELTGEPVEVVAVDGCGAPLLSASLTGLARAFRTLALAGSGAEARVANAIRRHPEMVSGSRRDELALLRAVPSAIGKAGAEACYAVALPDGRTVALKIDDGGARARPGRSWPRRWCAPGCSTCRGSTSRRCSATGAGAGCSVAAWRSVRSAARAV